VVEPPQPPVVEPPVVEPPVVQPPVVAGPRWYTHGRGDYRLRLPEGWKVIENTRNKLQDDDFDTLMDPTGQYILICAKVCEKTADADASLRRWLEVKRKQQQRWGPRAYRFTIAGAPAVRLIYLLPDSAQVITRMSVAYGGRRYTINCVAPAATGLDYLPRPVAGLLGTGR